jgi:hypothetical protein
VQTTAYQDVSPRTGNERLSSVNRLLLDALAAELAHERLELEPPSGWSDETWADLLASADWQRVTPALSGLPSDHPAVPDWAIDQIRAAETAFVARRLMVDAARARALRLLDDAGIPVMLLKGSALVECVYPPSLWRDMSDVDVLVEADRLAEARAALVACGYRPLGPDPSAPERDLPHHDAKLLDAEGIVPVELHRHVLDGAEARKWPIAETWSRARRSREGQHVLPSAADLLMHVCLHFIADRHVRSEGALAQVRDVAWIAQRDDVDWDLLETVTRRYGVLDRVMASLATARHLALLEHYPRLGSTEPRSADVACFVASRVLVNEARAPVGSWPRRLSSVRRALWWGRVHLGDLPAGELSDHPELRKDVVTSRTTGVTRMVRHLLVNAPELAVDVRAGRWLSSLD